VSGASAGTFGGSRTPGHTGHAGHVAPPGHAATDVGCVGLVAHAASAPHKITAAAAARTHVRMRRMDGFWIILLEIAVVLAIAAFIVWWTMRK